MGVVQKLCGWEEKERGGESGEGARRRKEKRFQERGFLLLQFPDNQPK